MYSPLNTSFIHGFGLRRDGEGTSQLSFTALPPFYRRAIVLFFGMQPPISQTEQKAKSQNHACVVYIGKGIISLAFSALSKFHVWE